LVNEIPAINHTRLKNLVSPETPHNVIGITSCRPIFKYLLNIGRQLFYKNGSGVKPLPCVSTLIHLKIQIASFGKSRTQVKRCLCPCFEKEKGKRRLFHSGCVGRKKETE
jgi:hypothetical protein